MKVVVTGGAGFIGSHIVDALVDAGCDVVVVDTFLQDAHRVMPTYLNPSADLERIDIRDANALRSIVDGAEAVLHQASMVGLGKSFADVTRYAAHNDMGTAALLEAMYTRSWRGRLLLASSMVVYGEGFYRCSTHGPVHPGSRSEADLRAGRFDPPCPGCGGALSPAPVTEYSPVDPRNVYAATKVHQEHLCAVFGREMGVPVAALRYHNVYGPRMPKDTPYAGVASVFRSSLERGEAAQVFEDGRQLRDFVHVSDVARANMRCLVVDPPVTGPINIGSGHPHSVAEMASVLTNAFGDDVPRPAVTARYRLGDVRHVFASIERAERLLGWRPEIDFEVGIKEFATTPQRA